MHFDGTKGGEKQVNMVMSAGENRTKNTKGGGNDKREGEKKCPGKS